MKKIKLKYFKIMANNNDNLPPNLNEEDFPYMWRVPKTALDAVYCIQNE